MSPVRLATVFFAALLAGLGWRLFLADGGIAQSQRLRMQIADASAELDILRVRNAALDAEVQDLNSGKAAIESRARITLGMIKPEETFYLVVE
ncbi:cell division protein FtsB [Hydrocarboniphaga daqingensis]|jgi:cell division protein FtsB|uniref:Cell division protein FtsB n=1 Tax=Hydrocarboniphaga daqingensis TaxID=490188 RepID=A0A1M5Q1D8_9GAMM|nr:septum formation initiator family protein [Hydrocarboniphaga daqingensis]SHH07726.1 cell division protein FtsB [Hydrocarboniphaga daqingensis]